MNKYQEALNSITKVCAYSEQPMPLEELDLLEKLTDKATPKKPIVIDKETNYLSCPCCGTGFDDEMGCPRYCDGCGQAIDWSEEE